MRKLNITVGQCLALLLWLAVQAAGAASVVSLFCLLAPVESAAAAADHQESATVRRFERALAKVQPLLARYGYGAAVGLIGGALIGDQMQARQQQEDDLQRRMAAQDAEIQRQNIELQRLKAQQAR